MKELLEAPWWIEGFWAIGVLAVAAALLSLFFALGRRPRRIWATQVPPVDSDEFLVGIAATVNNHVLSGGTAKLLNNGDEFFPAMLEAIRNARRSINFSAYIWEPGKASERMFAALVERARAGVQVRLLLDGMGGLRTPAEGIEALRGAGGKVETFRPPRFGKLTRFHQRNHRRAIVIDGAVGFIGGAAVGDKWLGNARNPDEWRDSMLRVTGSLAAELQSAFAEPWAYTCGEILIGPDYYPPPQAGSDGEGPVLRHTGVISSPSSEEHPVRLFFVLSFLAARERLYITTPYFVPDKHTRQTVMDRAREGVDVRILLPNELTDAKPIRLASHRYFEDLLCAGVRIFEYQPAMMHVKTVVVDGKWSVVGSPNMDVRSKELNLENVVGILDTGLAARLEETFLADLERAQEIRLEAWRRRGPGARLAERLAVVFEEQY